MSTNTDTAPGVAVKLRVVFHRNDDGPGYWAEVPGFPGCLTEGATLDQARANVREVVRRGLARNRQPEALGVSDHFDGPTRRQMRDMETRASQLGEKNIASHHHIGFGVGDIRL